MKLTLQLFILFLILSLSAQPFLYILPLIFLLLNLRTKLILEVSYLPFCQGILLEELVNFLRISQNIFLKLFDSFLLSLVMFQFLFILLKNQLQSFYLFSQRLVLFLISFNQRLSSSQSFFSHPTLNFKIGDILIFAGELECFFDGGRRCNFATHDCNKQCFIVCQFGTLVLAKQIVCLQYKLFWYLDCSSDEIYKSDLNTQSIPLQIKIYKNHQKLISMEQFDIFDHYLYNIFTISQPQIGYGFAQFVGVILMMLIAGLSSLAGLGGGGPNVVVMIAIYDILPKTATLVTFANIFGGSFGNVVNQMQRSLDNQPVINYSIALIVIPIIFMGALLGVFLNKLLPSAVLMAIIVSVATNSLPKIYKRFVDGHKKQTEQLLILSQNQGRASQIIQQTAINPFQNEINIRIFKRIILMIICYSCISLMRGSQKFPSILGISTCSLLYWFLDLTLFLQAILFLRSNKHLLEVWYAPAVTLGQMLFEKQQDIIGQNIRQIFISSFLAGIFNGFGLGGGVFLIPMLRKLKLSPLHATSTGAFIVCISSFINCLQVLFMGILSLKLFVFFFSVCSIGSFTISTLLSKYLRRINRLSYVQLMLFILLLTSNVYYPYALWLKYERSGRDLSVIFGFGSIC